DWCEASGAYSSQSSGYHAQGHTYYYDAARTPWRIVVDYLWHGTNDGKIYAKKCSDFVRVTLGGTANIVDGYNQNGTVTGQWHNATFVGAFACAAMAGENQAHLDTSYTDLKNLNEPNAYFNQTLKTLYQFLLTGNFYLPPTATLSNTTFENTVLETAIYPNPNNGVFTIQAPIRSSISILDVQGKEVFKTETTQGLHSVDMSQYSKGIYLVKITHENQQALQKIVLH
ncbi:glycosyl hydrolase family 8, partial [Flavobacterium sp. J27]|uniref:glycosyl hydrolase family 8 n=1 Tax=Flavobacterium sp. J27 TaxID=2060419 RepID=UPI001F11663A